MALFIAMSGAANDNAFLMDAISFNFKNGDSGVWSWAGKQNAISLMYNGRGTDVNTGLVTQLSRRVNVVIPAICDRKL